MLGRGLHRAAEKLRTGLAEAAVGQDHAHGAGAAGERRDREFDKVGKISPLMPVTAFMGS